VTDGEVRQTTTSAVPRSAWADAASWDREYESIRSIPSSLRSAPSRAVTRLTHAFGDLDGASVLDLGAGAGRHTAYLTALGAHVHAIDGSARASELHRALAEPASTTTIEVGVVDLGHLPDGRYDLIVDSYVSCHILSAEARLELLRSLMSRLRPGGRLYTAGMGAADDFYRRHIVPGLPEVIAVDPRNEIAKLLQPADIAARDGRSLGTLVAATTERFPDIVAGRREHREVHAAVLQR
jgi:SAM-dependent methyltransferase